jgi:adenosylcobinamide-GDP ribazoletransferase
MQGGISARGLSTDLRTGLAFCTRLPFVGGVSATGSDVARASWTFPIAGALVGLIGAFAYWLADRLGLPPFVSATLAVAATMLATGCLHEDGLADTVDGFGGGGTAERKLEIMRDSRIGAYGASALFISLMLRAGAIASLVEPHLVASALFAAHAGARAALPVFMRRVPAARRDGLLADAGRPPSGMASIAVLLALIALVIGLGFGGALTAVVLLTVGVGPLAWISIRQVGGQTGDVLGAVEQAGEILILLVATSWLQT